MIEYSVNEVIDLHKIFMVMRSNGGTSWWFRGQSDISWDLLPKAGRKEYSLKNNLDLGRFKFWRDQALIYDKNLPENDWECLAIAQHYGLATRLLDWTYNPLIATFFAVNECFDKDGVIYGYEPEIFIEQNILSLDTSSKVSGFIPRVFSNRILNQKSLFTVHSPATEHIIEKPSEMDKDMSNIFRIPIRKELKKKIQKHISDYGFTFANMFPDLEGLSKHVNWETTEVVEFHYRK